jgi:hypothetical protein
LVFHESDEPVSIDLIYERRSAEIPFKRSDIAVISTKCVRREVTGSEKQAVIVLPCPPESDTRRLSSALRR